MKRIKLLLLSAFVCFGMYNAMAQTKVSGQVTSSEDGQPIPGVTVIVKGLSGVGTSTNIEGKYTLNVPAAGKNLVFSYIGFLSQEVAVAGKMSINVVLVADTKKLEEVVVTALGISRAKKALGYAVQDVQGDELSKAKNQNVVSALSGRVSGIQITTATGQMGGGAKINIRGNSSLTKSNQPLFVVDGVAIDNSDYSYGATGGGGYDYGNLATDINPDDVENVTVLKGASASALYGSRAANGVVLVTTKKGKAGLKKNIGVSVSSSVAFNKVSMLPKYQTYSGGGTQFSGAGTDAGFKLVTINGKQYHVVDYATDEGWGPKYDPNVKVLNWNAFDSWDKQNYLVEKPWVYPKNDYSTYFRTGVTTQNNISLTGGNENTAYRLSYTRVDETGIYPNSSLKKNTLNFSGNSNLTKYLNSWFVVNYIQNTAKGRPETGYGDRNPVQKMWQWIQPQLDYSELRDYMNPDGTQRSWNRNAWNDAGPAYTDNPYWSNYKNYQNDRRDRVYGNTGFTLTFIPGLKLTSRVGIDFYTFLMQERTAIGSQSQSEYLKDVRSFCEMNYESFFNFEKRFFNDKIGISALLGMSRMDRRTWRSGGVTSGGLLVPNLYNLSNSFVKANVYDNETWKRINSVYGNVTVDYDRKIYLDFTARNDWSSTLPSGSRSYFYPSVNISIVGSEFDFMKTQDIISFLKLRANFAEVGSDTSPYDYQTYLNINPTFMDSYLNMNPRMTLPSTKPNPYLKSEKTSSWETGLEIKFLNNRIGIDAAYFYKKTTDQIMPVRVPGATGYDFKNINAGEMTNKGFEISITGTPIKTKDFSWDLTLNVAKIENKVVDLDTGLDFLTLGSGPFKVQSGAYRGMAYPIIYGTDYVYDDNGNKIVDTDGLYLSSPIKPLANVTPDFTAGLNSTFSYKGFDMSILLDMQRGGHIYYLSQMWGTYSGILAETATINDNGKNIREDVASGGGALSNGVYGYVGDDGKVKYTDANGNASATPVSNKTHVNAETWGGHFNDGPDMQSIFKTDYLKLRELRVGYTIPARFTGRVKDVRISAFARNLATWGNDNKNFDPEYLQMAGSNAQGIEGGYLPSTKTYGFSLNFNF